MELKRIIISEIHEQQVILLKEVDGDRNFSIMIGIFEATSIDRRVKHLPSPRPLTHDLVTGAIDALGGELRDIYISELREHTYYAKLRIRQNGEMVEVDCRPERRHRPGRHRQCADLCFRGCAGRSDGGVNAL